MVVTSSVTIPIVPHPTCNREIDKRSVRRRDVETMNDEPDESWRPTHTETGEREADTGGHPTRDGSARAGESRDRTTDAEDPSAIRFENRVPGELDHLRGDWR